ncbi:MAG TPA: response regulator [Candidatus Tectomicrobia bacterium]|jgi:CheY-like chemotaxis protein
MANILIVDDHPANRQYLGKLLGYSGHHLLEASNGAEALKLACSAHPDLIISDILMPEVDGFQFVRQLRTDPTTTYTPVIFYTAVYGESEVRQIVKDCHATHFLAKPSEPQNLLNKINAVLRLSNSRIAPVPSEDFDQEHQQLLTNKLFNTIAELELEVDERKRVEQALREAHDE